MRDNAMTEEARNILLGIGVMAILLVASCELRAKTPRYYDEQLLNYRYSEFCAAVKKPPPALAEAINGAVAQDPQTWLPIVAWWNRIHEHYEKARCGDA